MGKVCRLILVLSGVAITCSALATVVFGVWVCFSDIVDFWGLEHNVVYSVIKLLSGRPLYTDPLSPPFDLTQYAPLYYVLTAGVAAALGIEAQSVYQVSVVARGVSTMCAALLCAAIYLFATRVLMTGRSVAALCSATVLVLESQWLFLGLTNSLNSLCMFLAVALTATSLVRSPSGDRSEWLVLILLSALFGAAAVLTKQSGMQVLLLIGSFLALKRRWAQLLCLLVVSALALAVFFLLAQPLLGSSLKENLIDGIRNPIALKASFVTTYHAFFSQLSILVAYATVVTLDWFGRSRTDVQMFLLWVMWGTLAFALVTGLKIGSSVPYFNDFIVMLAPCAALHLTRALEAQPKVSQPDGKLVVLLAVTFLCLVPTRTIYTIGRNVTSLQVVPNTYSSRTAVVDYLRANLAHRPTSWFFAEDQVLPLFLPQHGLLPHPDVMAYYLGKEVALENYMNLAANGSVAYIVRSDPHKLTPAFIPKPDWFTLEAVIGPYRIYRNDRGLLHQ